MGNWEDILMQNIIRIQ